MPVGRAGAWLTSFMYSFHPRLQGQDLAAVLNLCVQDRRKAGPGGERQLGRGLCRCQDDARVVTAKGGAEGASSLPAFPSLNTLRFVCTLQSVTCHLVDPGMLICALPSECKLLEDRKHISSLWDPWGQVEKSWLYGSRSALLQQGWDVVAPMAWMPVPQSSSAVAGHTTWGFTWRNHHLGAMT